MKNFISIILIILFLTAIGLTAFDIFKINSEGAKCMNDPIVYSVQQLTESNQAEVICTCTASKPGNPSIIVTKDGITTPKIDNVIQNEFSVNLSEAFDKLK